MYFDIYFEGNEIVQIVIGYDYAKLAKNIYDYTIEYDEESMEDEGIKSYDDFVEYMNEQISTMLDKDEICKAIMESMDETATQVTLDLLENQSQTSSNLESMFIISHNNYAIPVDSRIVVVKGADRVSTILEN